MIVIKTRNQLKVRGRCKSISRLYIAANATIAASAIVTMACYEEGVTLAGVPTHIIKRTR